MDLALLKSVSRSFYVTLRLLPSAFQKPVALAYLLARASDTLVDTLGVAMGEREELLQEFVEGVRKGEFEQGFRERVSSRFSPNQKHAGEKELLERVEELGVWLGELREDHAEAVQRVFATIAKGQCWDLTRFEDGQSGVPRLENDEELERYTWQVAGVVGRFWTEIGLSFPRFSKLSEQELMALGESYGKGLQLVNILRDVGDDWEKERCYLPGLTGESPEDVWATAEQWIERAEKGLEDGLCYALSLRSWRLRVASELPARLGLRTLALLKGREWAEVSTGVKVSRSVVWQELTKAIFSR